MKISYKKINYLRDSNSDENLISSSRNFSNDLNRSPKKFNDQSSYTILTGPDDATQLIDCRIIIVNSRQRLDFIFKKQILLIKYILENMVKKSLLIFVVMVLLHQ